jgi:hypothetical protein
VSSIYTSRFLATDFKAGTLNSLTDSHTPNIGFLISFFSSSYHLIYLIFIFTFHLIYCGLVPVTYSVQLTHGDEHFLRICQLYSYSRTSQCFMESEGLLLCSQEPSTGPYSEPDQSNPSFLSKIYFNIVHPPAYTYSVSALN